MDGVGSAADWKEFSIAIKGVVDGGMVEECLADGKKLGGDACKRAFLLWYCGAHQGFNDAFKPPSNSFPALSPQTRDLFVARLTQIALSGGFKSAAAFDNVTRTTFAAYGKCCVKMSPPREECPRCYQLLSLYTRLLDPAWWQTLTQKQRSNVLDAKLLLLRKKASDLVPDISKIRPITCTSHSVKAIEDCLRIGLISWITHARSSLLAHQHAYVAHRSTVTARVTARQHALAAAKNADSCLLFVDFSDAFGSVRRDQLLAIVQRHAFWQDDQVALWRWLWSSQEVRCGRARGSPSLGIPQGSKIGG
jgi:hypothetical protein